MTQNKHRRASLECLGEPFGARDEIENLLAPGLEERRCFYGNGVTPSVNRNTRQERLDAFAPLRRICLWLDAVD